MTVCVLCVALLTFACCVVLCQITFTVGGSAMVDLKVLGLPGMFTQLDSIRAEVASVTADKAPTTPPGDDTCSPNPTAQVVGLEHTKVSNVEAHLRAVTDPLTKRAEALKVAIKNETRAKARMVQQRDTVTRYTRTRFEAVQPEQWETGSNMQELLEWVSTTLTKLDEDISACTERRRELERQLAAVELQQRRSDDVSAHDESLLDVVVNVRVATPTPATVVVRLKYLTAGASWTPSYDVALETLPNGAAQLELNYYAEVHQHTAEHWRNVTLHLSTATPSVAGAPPPVFGHRVKWASHGSIQDFHNRAGHSAHHGGVHRAFGDAKVVQHKYQAAWDSLESRQRRQREMYEQRIAYEEAGDEDDGFVHAGSGSARGGVVTTQSGVPSRAFVQHMDMRTGSSSGSSADIRLATGEASDSDVAGISQDATVGTTGTATFRIHHRATVRHGSRGRRVLMRTLSVDAQLVHEVFPEQMSSAYLRAMATNTATFPLLASSQVFVWVDGDFVARSTMGFASPGASFHVHLGVDNDVTVRVEAPHEQHSKTSTMLWSHTEQHNRRRTTVVYNNKGASSPPLHVVVNQVVPASDDEEIVVNMVRPPRSMLVANAGAACTAGTKGCACRGNSTDSSTGGTHDAVCFVEGTSLVDAQPRRLVRHMWLASGHHKDLPFEFQVAWPGDDTHHRHGVEVYVDHNARLSMHDAAAAAPDAAKANASD